MLCRGEEHADAFGSAIPWPLSPYLTRELRKTGRPPFVEAYNREHVGKVKAVLGDVPLALVGGMRTVGAMQECLDGGSADLISLSRPLLREPHLVAKLKADPAAVPACTNCTRCLAACFYDVPIRCYVNGIPKNRRGAGEGAIP